jgi:L-aminopeptidase/D-esterase-like protein
MNGTITAIKGIKVGHSASKSRRTGCTVLLFDRPAVTTVEARGGWPGTFDTDSIGQGKTFFKKHAIFLTGGDVFGL